MAILVAQDLAVIPLLLITTTLGGELTARAAMGVGARLALAFALLAAFIHVLNKVKSFRFPASRISS